jgi:hypothetical protein
MIGYFERGKRKCYTKMYSVQDDTKRVQPLPDFPECITANGEKKKVGTIGLQN